MKAKSDLSDDMRIDWDVPIEMLDGLVLRADVYAPPGPFSMAPSYFM